MGGGSNLNIMYVEMLDAMGVDWSRVRPTRAPFHGIMSRKQAKHLRQIDLPVTFGDKSNFRIETLTFEVVGFHGTYHAILGRPCYAKFMAVPNYMYLKLKMPGPHGVITVGTSFQCTYECDLECYELIAMTIASEELTVIRESVAADAPNSKQQAEAFEPTEGTKEVPLDPNDPNRKVLQIGADISPK
jgi:hypothetical protein